MPGSRPDIYTDARSARSNASCPVATLTRRTRERERHIAVLHSHGFARKEIAGRMGVTPRIVKRSVEEILATGRQQLTRLVGYGCADGHDLVSRYAFGLGSPREARRAQLHLTTCDRCGSMFERLDLWRERVAALVPIPPAVEVHGDAIERVLHAGTDAVSATQPAAGEHAVGARSHLSDAIAQAREHATSVYYRVIDPTPLVGVRPGAVAAAVAGCIAVGGGATYCVQQNADPLAVFGGLGRTEQRAAAALTRVRPLVAVALLAGPTFATWLAYFAYGLVCEEGCIGRPWPLVAQRRVRRSPARCCRGAGDRRRCRAARAPWRQRLRPPPTSPGRRCSYSPRDPAAARDDVPH